MKELGVPKVIGKTKIGETIKVKGYILKVQSCSTCDKDCFNCLNGYKVGKFKIDDNGNKVRGWYKDTKNTKI